VVRNPDPIIACSTNLTLDFKATTTTIPIVGVFAAPIEAGIVPSLALLAGNITGISVNVGFGQWDKRIQFLQLAEPQLTRLWVLEPRATRDPMGSSSTRGLPKEQNQLGGATARPSDRRGGVSPRIRRL